MASKAQDKVRQITAQINRKMPKTSKAVAKSLPETAGKKGHAIHFWLHDQDRQLIQELRIWLMSQGRRPTESQVVRAALRIAQHGPALLAAQDEVAALDGRRKAS